MLIIPAIDLQNGKCVRLAQGRKEAATVYDGDPVEIAKSFELAGAHMLHIVDLDAAFSDRGSSNRRLLREIIGAIEIPVQFGGGLRNSDDVKEVIELGVTRVVIGTLAVESPETLAELVQIFGGDHIAVGIDAKDGEVMVRGWEQGGKIRKAPLQTSRARCLITYCWVIRAAEEDHRGHDHAEHQTDLLLADRAAEDQAEGRGEHGHEQGLEDEESGLRAAHADAPHHQPAEGNHHQAGHESLDHSCDDLLHGQPFQIHGGEQPVLDLLGELELGDERHRHRPGAGHDHAQGDDAGKEQRLVLRRHQAAGGHHPAEDEHEHHRLQQGLKGQLHGVAPGDMGVARQHGQKGRHVHSRRLRPV